MTTATMTITRAVNVPKFYDAAGIPETEAEDIDIEVTLSGSYAPAEPDVGIFSSYFSDIYAEDEHGNEVELTNVRASVRRKRFLKRKQDHANQ